MEYGGVTLFAHLKTNTKSTNWHLQIVKMLCPLKKLRCSRTQKSARLIS